MCDPGYLAWCSTQGIQMHHVQPGMVAEGWRGVVATAALSPGDVVMSVPEVLLMSVLSAQRDPQLGQALAHHQQQQQQQQQLSSHQVLTLHLLHEASKAAASRWHPYIQQLPRQHSSCVHWGAQAVHALQLQYAQEAVQAAIDKARGDWTAARPVLQRLGVDKKWCSWRAWQWASSMVTSRTMFLPSDPSCGCLTPLADLHNHAPPPAPHTPDLGEGLRELLLLLEQEKQQQQEQEQQQEQQEQQEQEGQQLEQQEEQQEEQQQAVGQDLVQLQQKHKQQDQQQDQQQDANRQQTCGGSSSSSSQDDATTAVAQPPDTSTISSSSSTGEVGGAGSGSASAAPAGGGETPAAGSNGQAVVDADVDVAAEEAAIGGDGHFDEAAGCYKIVARRGYQAGDQVFLCYGRHTNLELLELYGFLLPPNNTSNPHDTALLPVELLQDTLQRLVHKHARQQQQPCFPNTQQQGPHWHSPGLLQTGGQQLLLQQQQQHQQQRKHQGWQQQQSSGHRVELDLAAADCWVHSNGQPSWQLLSALRCAAACPAEAAALGYKALCGEPISLHSELLAVQALAASCKAQLAALPTTQQQDEQLMQQQLRGAAQGEEGVAVVSSPAAASSCGCAGVGTAAEDESGCASCGCDHRHKQPTQQQSEQQQPQPAKEKPGADATLQAECIALALQWRHNYKAALWACVELCEEALQSVRPLPWQPVVTNPC